MNKIVRTYPGILERVSFHTEKLTSRGKLPVNKKSVISKWEESSQSEKLAVVYNFKY